MIELVGTGSDLSNIHQIVEAKTINKGKSLDPLLANLKQFPVRPSRFSCTVHRLFPSVSDLTKLVLGKLLCNFPDIHTDEQRQALIMVLTNQVISSPFLCSKLQYMLILRNVALGVSETHRYLPRKSMDRTT